MKILLFVSLAITSVFAFSDDFINEINSKQNSWVAGRNFPINTTLSEVHGLVGSKLLPQEILEKIPVKYHEVNDDDLPGSFDSRVRWPKCNSIKQITDQSSCGAGWAVAASSTMNDRICIHSDGKLQTQISARNLMACDTNFALGCDGGYAFLAFNYWRDTGIVTGGPYGSKIGCQPYPFPPCEHYVNGSEPKCSENNYDTPTCVKSCDDASLSYEKELVYGGSAYRLDYKEDQIRAEIYKNGPVVATFNVIDDLLHYKSGVYYTTTGNSRGVHVVRIIGWGEEKGTKYWLVANSWNEDWGDKGLFKIRRGFNECGIENDVSAGLPIQKHSSLEIVK